MGPPHQQGPVFRIAAGIIVFRHLNGKAFPQISFIFLIQRNPVVFRMAHHINLAAVPGHSQKDSRLIRFRQDHQILAGGNVIPGHFRMAGMGRQKHIVKSSHQRNLSVLDPVPEQSEHLFIQFPLL